MAGESNNQIKSFAIKFASGGMLLVALGALYFYGTPRQFEASAKVRVWKRGSIHTNEATATFRPEMLPAECAIMLSSNVLDPVITNLTLLELWGDRFSHGKPMKPEHARDRLRLISRIQPFGGSSVIDIRVSGEEPVEPAKIANAIANAYCELRRSQRSQATADRGQGLREQWAAVTAKIQASRENLNRLYFEITTERATNQSQIVSADDLSLLQSKRIDTESQYVRDKTKLEELKALDRDRQREILSSLDSDPNSLLNNIILQLFKARRALAAANNDHGPDSAEVKQAGLLVAELDRQVNQQVDAIMTGKARDLIALKASLDRLNELCRQAGANSNLPTIKAAAAQDARYAKARLELVTLEAEGDRLQQQMNASVVDDVIPVTLFAETLDSADPPAKPAVPDPKIAVAVAGAGSLAMVAGLVMTLIGSRVKKSSRPEA